MLDSAAIRLPEDDPHYPTQLRLVLFELFSYLRHAASPRREGKDRAAAIASIRAVYTFLARFQSGADDDLLASFLSLESALMALVSCPVYGLAAFSAKAGPTARKAARNRASAEAFIVRT